MMNYLTFKGRKFVFVAVLLAVFVVIACGTALAKPLSDIAEGFIVQYTYVAVFCILVLCGIGLPIPEEVTLIISGYISDPSIFPDSASNIYWIIVACSIGILVGDTMTYLAGRLLGSRIFATRIGRLILSEKNLKRAEDGFKKHGWRVVFIARFFAGFRMAVYFLTGSMKKSIFMLWFFDLLGVLISVPISVFIGYVFSRQIDDAFRYIAEVKRDALFVTLALLIVAGIVYSVYKRMKANASGNKPS